MKIAIISACCKRPGSVNRTVGHHRDHILLNQNQSRNHIVKALVKGLQSPVVGAIVRTSPRRASARVRVRTKKATARAKASQLARAKANQLAKARVVVGPIRAEPRVGQKAALGLNQ